MITENTYIGTGNWQMVRSGNLEMSVKVAKGTTFRVKRAPNGSIQIHTYSAYEMIKNYFEGVDIDKIDGEYFVTGITVEEKRQDPPAWTLSTNY